MASFTYSPERPMVGGNIEFDASLSGDPDGTIVSYEWDFGDANYAEGEIVTHTYAGAGEYTVTLIVTDNDGLTDSTQQTIKINAPPVADFTYWEEDEYRPSGVIAGRVNLLGKKVIIDASPSYDPDGTIVDTRFTVEGRHMETNPGWPFWNHENQVSAYFPREDYTVTLHVTDNDGLVSETAKTIQIHLYPALLSAWNIPPGGGMIPIGPGMFLGGSLSHLTIYYKYDGEYYVYGTTMLGIIFPNSSETAFFSTSGYHEIWSCLTKDVPANAVNMGYIKYDLPNERILEVEGLGKYIGLIYEAAVYQCIYASNGTVAPSDSHSHEAYLDNMGSDAIFSLEWGGSDLDFVLYTPENGRIDPNVAESDPNVHYEKNATYAYYKLDNPPAGNWKLDVTAVNVPDEGEPYTITTLLNTDLRLEVETDKVKYNVGEPITIRASHTDNNLPITGAMINAKIECPNDVNDTIVLYDDETHGDEDANDGIYTNTYINTSLRGLYIIIISATGELSGEQYERVSILKVLFRSVIYVDDDAANDPGPGNPDVSDPLEVGSVEHPFDSIQEAIDQAEDGDVVLVASGTYTCNGNRDIKLHGKRITVQSLNVPIDCVIDCQGSDEEYHRGFVFQNSETENSIIEGFAIVNGHGKLGGAIYCQLSSPTIKNCIISNCSSDDAGGGISFKNSSPRIKKNVIANCLAYYNGGAIHCENSVPRIVSNTIKDCFASFGGAICSIGSSPKVLNNEVFDNVATYGGGGIFCYGGRPLISSNWITYNYHSGIYSYESSPIISSSLIAGNEGFLSGGIACDANSAPIIKNNTIIENWGQESGGIGLDVGSTATVTNCIIWNNFTDTNENQISLFYDEYFAKQTVLDINYSDIEHGFENVYLQDSNCILTWGTGNISTDPCFIETGLWDTNDIWWEGDYHLLSNSSCIDTGDPNYPEDSNEYDDIDGDTRIIGGRIDIGADEYTFGELSDFSGNGIVNFEDFAILAYYWKDYVCEEPDWCEGCDFDESGIVDHNDLRRFAENWLWQASWYNE